MPGLREDQIEVYRREGYVVVPGLIDETSLQAWDRRFEDVVLGRVPAAPNMLVMKDVMVAKGAVQPESPLEAIQKIQDYEGDPVLDEYTIHAPMLRCVQSLIGDEIMSIHTMLINKPPNVDGRHPIHQDLLYFPFRPPERIVATWTAMTRVTKENGCLVVLPKSHLGELIPHENPDWEFLNGGYFGAKDVGDALAQRVHLEMEPGDTVFFHPILLHGSGRNRTNGFRRAISAHYASADCEWTWEIDPADYQDRHYRLVTGPRAGQRWTGRTAIDNRVDALEFIPKDNPLRNNPHKIRGKS